MVAASLGVVLGYAFVLTTLNLSGNNHLFTTPHSKVNRVSVSSSGALHFFQGLRVNTSLRYLNISGCNLLDTGVKHLAKALQINSTLTTLNISNNHISTGKHVPYFCACIYKYYEHSYGALFIIYIFSLVSNCSF